MLVDHKMQLCYLLEFTILLLAINVLIQLKYIWIKLDYIRIPYILTYYWYIFVLSFFCKSSQRLQINP